jgi:hypothetical protein
MKYGYALAAAVLAMPVWAAEPAPLPPDVTAYLERDRQTPACQPNYAPGLSTEQIVYNYILARQSATCAALERERLELLARYKDNRDIADALALKLAFVGDAL